MSRIGLKPVPVPPGVEVTIDDNKVTVKGSKGELTREFHENVSFEMSDGEVTVSRADDTRESRALHGLSRALLNNMVVGVTDGFSAKLEIQGVGYRAAMKGSDIELQVGFSHPVTVSAPAGIAFEVPEANRIVVRGNDKQMVGEVAANVRKVRKPEPYKGKGIRYEGEYVRKKAGKAGVAR
ncbi:MAG: 50S ribosomal protein L6 [Actinobacteria bacterium]|nr:50S ribosomal protein L6 [Actinomycetota bacterium]